MVVTITRLAYAAAVAISAVMTVVSLIGKIRLGRWSAASP